MSSPPVWYADRSRYEAGFSCPFSRLLRYHMGGTGWEPHDPAIELASGNHLHTFLEKILIEAKAKGSPLSLSEVDDVLKMGHPLPSTTELVGLAHGWARVNLPWLMENYDIVSAEQELSIKIEDDIEWMARPDAIVRHKVTGLPCVVEFKSTRAKADRMAQLYANSLQSIMNAYAVSTHFGQPCGEVQIHMLQLGNTEWPTAITHAFMRAGQPPYVTEDWQPKSRVGNKWLGKLYRKVPVADFRTVQSWVWSMPGDALSEIVPVLPVTLDPGIQGLKVIQALSSIWRNESDWRDVLSSINWSTTTFAELGEKVPRSFQCHTYNRLCDFTAVCFDPTNHARTFPPGTVPDGLRIRIPHHTQETT